MNNLNYELLGNQIRKQRKLKKYTLEQLAERLEVSTTFIGQIERAKGIPSLETLVKIANVLEISTDTLLFGDLNTKAGDTHFTNQILQMTSDFSSVEKDLLLKSIAIICELRKSDEDKQSTSDNQSLV